MRARAALQVGLRADGFTLLEVIAALAVFGLLLTGLAQGVQFGVRANAVLAHDAARRQDMEAVDRTLRLLVRRIEPGDDRHPVATLQGGPDAMDLLTQLPAAPGALASRQVSARLETRGGHLLLRWQPAPHAAWLGTPPTAMDTVLLDGVQRLEAAYWKESPGGGGAWQRSWTDVAPPSLVRLRIVFVAGTAWPDIVVAPALDHA